MLKIVLVTVVVVVWVGGFMAIRHTASTAPLRALFAAIAFAPLPFAVAMLRKQMHGDNPGELQVDQLDRH